jgi:hypothetical protein
MAALVSSGKQEEGLELWSPEKELTHWVASRQLPIEVIVRGMEWKDAVRLAACSPQTWPHVEQLVTLARPDWDAALDENTPDRLRIPLLTGLTREQVRAENNEALRRACVNGHLATAQWLTERFQLTAEDARANNNQALREACINGHLATAQWLTERFQLTAEDARANNNYALRWACRCEHLAVAQWLTERFQLTAEDAQTNNNEALRWACMNGHLAVAQWLTERFGITRAEINN